MKKYLALIFICLPPFLAMAQSNRYEVRGTIGQYDKPAKAYLTYVVAGKRMVDSAGLDHGAFIFKGVIDTPSRAFLSINPMGDGLHRPYDRVMFFLDKGATVVSSPDSAMKAVFSGNKTVEDYKVYQAILAANEHGEGADDSLARAQDARKRAALTMFVQQHPASVACIDALNNLSYDAVVKADFNRLEPLFNAVAPVIRHRADFKACQENFEKLKPLAIGEPAPAFAQPDTSGKVIKLSDFRGQYVLVDFWASWCEPCRAENPNLLKTYQAFKDKKFTILGISLDNNRAAWSKAVMEDQLAWLQVSDLSRRNQAAGLYNIVGIPSNFLIGPDGRIVAKNLQGEALTRKLEALLH